MPIGSSTPKTFANLRKDDVEVRGSGLPFAVSDAWGVCRFRRAPRFSRQLSGYIAELGAVFLAADLGIVPEMEPRPGHASYLASWLSVLQTGKCFVVQAAAHAQRAVSYLHNLQPTARDEAA
ncbi:hypothetical protein HFO69_26920 [Rhizobium laguerreae]|nr:hypothetical protein [Rhizobium laguerreae]